MALIIFDLDGTLVDSLQGLAVGMNKVLDELGLPIHAHEAYKNFVGNGFEKLVEQALPYNEKHQLSTAVERMLYHYKDHYNDGLTPYDGIYKMLDDVVAQGHSIALNTNKSQAMAEVIMDDYFSTYPWVSIIGQNEEHPGKPNPMTVLQTVELSRPTDGMVFMVGDTEVDLEVARNAGIQEVFVTWGFRELEQVAHMHAKEIIDSPIELIDVIQKYRTKEECYD